MTKSNNILRDFANEPKTVFCIKKSFGSDLITTNETWEKDIWNLVYYGDININILHVADNFVRHLITNTASVYQFYVIQDKCNVANTKL